jgi:FAD/FMN-containing dehydrogenase
MTALKGREIFVSEPAMSDFAKDIRGSVLNAGQPEYEQARRVFNGIVDKRPGLIVRPADAADVQRSVDFAREHGLLVSVKGGGHSVQGFGVCEGGLMIDLSLMRSVKVDPNTRTAVAEGGAVWGEFDAATQEHGLAIPGGRVPSTGIGGLTLGSGSGWLERKLGYTVDSMIGAEVVLANGELVNADEVQHSDLFWALRGGGGNFGIVTRFIYRLHPIGPIIYGGILGFRPDAAILRAYRDFMEEAPDDVCGGAALITAPPAPFVPREIQGQPLLAIVVCYTGDPERGEQAFAPILDMAPVLPLAQPMPYVEFQKLLAAGNPEGMQNYWKSEMYPLLPDAAMEVMLEKAVPASSPLHTVLIQPLGGQVHRVPDDATATGWRASARWSIHILGMWADPAENEHQIAWVRSLSDVLQPWAQKGTYLNYLMDEGEQRIKDSFGANYERIVAIKDRYDPANFFRLNQNIRPSGALAALRSGGADNL